MKPQHSKSPADKKSGSKRFGRTLIINLCIMVATTFLLVWVALMWLDVWTSHGEYEIVPDVEGMECQAAIQKLSSEGFVIEVSDSLYDSTSLPGTVLAQNPRQGAKVKHGREIFLTINATSPKIVNLPSVVDVSERQAVALLKGAGLTNISVEMVPSEYKDLVLGVRSNGRILSPGIRLAINTPIVIEVGMGQMEVPDSLSEEISVDEDMSASDFDF